MKRRFAAAVAAAALLLAGCQTPGTAATVNGERISELDVSNTVQQLGIEMDARNVLSMIIQEKFLSELADRAGVYVTDEYALSVYNSMRVQSGMQPLEDSVLGDAALDFLRSYIYATETAAANPGVFSDFEVLQQQADIEVSSRYGSYELATVQTSYGPQEQYTVVPAELPWITAPGTQAGR